MLLKKTENKEYRFIIAYIIFEILLNIILSFSAIEGFSLTPYLRIGFVFFTVLFFSFDFIRIKIPVKIGSTFSYSNIFVFAWLFFAVISLIIGVANKNPMIYIATDFIYILLGALLFYITEKRVKSKIIPLDNIFLKLSKVLVVLSFLCLAFNLKAPAILLVSMVILIYLNVLKKRYFYAVLILVPYFILVVSSNRTQLIIFFLMILILFLRKTRYYFSKKSVVLFGLTIVVLMVFFRQQIIESLLYFVDPESNIGYRINQIAVVFKEGIDYSNPFFTSIVQRILEAEAVFEYWTTDLISFIFGSGSGGVIDGSKLYSDTSVLSSSLLGADKVHNIHILPFALIFRYGLIGLILFCLLLIMVYKSVIKVLNEEENLEKIFWNLFFIFWFFFSMPAASFLWAMPVFWLSLSFIKKKNI